MNGERIRQAREILGLTQTELSLRAGIAQSAIAQIEAGIYVPSDAAVQAIAMQTGFDVAFLKQAKPPAEFPIGSILYRTQAKVNPKDKARAHRIAQFMFDMVLTMRTKLKDIPVLIPRTSEPPKIAAEIARASLGLSPESPVANLINALERAGVLVLQLPFAVEGLDGFSSWVGINHDTPVICLLAGKTGYRTRFTVAEEFGHLVQHMPLRCTVSQADDEARRFAGELLLPEEVVSKEIAHPVTLASLGPSRTRHRVSFQFLIRRISDLGIITQNQYRYLMMQISARGWRKEEPGDPNVVQEKPLVFSKMAEFVYGNPLDLARIKQDVGGVPATLIRSILGSMPSGPEPNPRGVLAFKRRAS
jgi:Zn-dependent peptidase ImmA (M78 family)/transcriptional regulator with XRE-family HTH domain